MIRSKTSALFVFSLALAGAVVTLRVGDGGMAVLFGAIGAVSAFQLLPEKGRRPIRLRPDLASWLDQVSASTAEPMEDVLDRSVSAYRASLRRSADE